MHTIKLLKIMSLATVVLVGHLSSTRAEEASGGVNFTRAVSFVPGEYVGEAGQQRLNGSMYVETLTPRSATQPYPIVFFHGSGQTAVNWMQTPDGRQGWATYFVEQGFTVHIIDQPARGRSAYLPGINGELRTFAASDSERLFTYSKELGTWPQAKKHTQWPGSGRVGDPAFDQFYASQVQFLESDEETQELVQKAGAALLDKIGPAILVTHSQAGAFGWLLADVRPDLVKGIVALEPDGPPIQKGRPWGPTVIKLTYEPPVSNASDLAVTQQAVPDKQDLALCWEQDAPARKLPNLAEIPVAVLISEASYHAAYDHCTAKYLLQAGVPVETFRLEDFGLQGNGHMMMLEKNNLEIARFVADWIGKTVKSK